MAVNWSDKQQVNEFRQFALNKGASAADVEDLINKNTGVTAPMSVAGETTPQVEITSAPKMEVSQPSLVEQPQEQQVVEKTPVLEVPKVEIDKQNVPVVQQPQIEQQTKQEAPAMGDVRVTQNFGNPNARLYGRNPDGSAKINRGLDVAKDPGQSQYAPSEGKWVVKSAYTGNGFNTGWGRSVVIENTETGETIRRSHLDKVLVQPGQEVTGQQLGTTGRTGRTTGYHADIEYTNPKGVLSDYSKTPYFAEEGRGGSDEYIPNTKYLYK